MILKYYLRYPIEKQTEGHIRANILGEYDLMEK